MKTDEYIVYGNDSCFFCNRAVMLLEEHDLNFTKHDVKISEEEINAFKKKFPNAKTIPQIVYYDENGEETHIGGFTDLQKYLR